MQPLRHRLFGYDIANNFYRTSTQASEEARRLVQAWVMHASHPDSPTHEEADDDGFMIERGMRSISQPPLL